MIETVGVQSQVKDKQVSDALRCKIVKPERSIQDFSFNICTPFHRQCNIPKGMNLPIC